MTDFTRDCFITKLLSKVQALTVSATFDRGDSFYFVERFQEKHVLAGKATMTVEKLIHSIQRVEDLYKQHPVDMLKCKALARDVFFDSQWLKQDPVVAVSEGDSYLVSGRHRVMMLAHVFAQIASDDQDFDDLMNQEIRVNVITVENKTNMLDLIMSYNESRTMRKAEQSHLKAQMFGADASGTDSITSVVFGADAGCLKPREVVEMAAQAFSRRETSLAKQQTLQVIGQYVCKELLFGKGKLSSKSELIVEYENYEEQLDNAWFLLLDTLSSKGKVKQSARSVAELVLKQLSYTEPLSTEEKPHEPCIETAHLDEVVAPSQETDSFNTELKAEEPSPEPTTSETLVPEATESEAVEAHGTVVNAVVEAKVEKQEPVKVVKKRGRPRTA